MRIFRVRLGGEVRHYASEMDAIQGATDWTGDAIELQLKAMRALGWRNHFDFDTSRGRMDIDSIEKDLGNASDKQIKLYMHLLSNGGLGSSSEEDIGLRGAAMEVTLTALRKKGLINAENRPI